jgi:hypothetical protein
MSNSINGVEEHFAPFTEQELLLKRGERIREALELEGGCTDIDTATKLLQEGNIGLNVSTGELFNARPVLDAFRVVRPDLFNGGSRGPAAATTPRQQPQPQPKQDGDAALLERIFVKGDFQFANQLALQDPTAYKRLRAKAALQGLR